MPTSINSNCRTPMKKTVEIIKTPDINVEFEGNMYRYLSYINHGKEKMGII